MSNEYLESIVPSSQAFNIVDSLSQDLHSEMTYEERLFLVETILKTKPHKCVEVGVSAGASSVLILSTLQYLYGDKTPILNSIDLDEKWYRDSKFKTGFVVDKFPDLKKNYQLYVKGYICDFIDIIGTGIDFVLIDTVHVLPGEVLDFLMILPYLNDNAVIIFHDTNLHTVIQYDKKNLQYKFKNSEWSICNNILLSSIHGKKFIMNDYKNLLYKNIKDKKPYPAMPNIAAVKIDNLTKQYVFDIVNLLSIGWIYYPNEHDLNKILNHLKAQYNKDIVDYIQMTLEFQKRYHSTFLSKSINHIRFRELIIYIIKRILKKISLYK